jgi:hypothetical protein
MPTLHFALTYDNIFKREKGHPSGANLSSKAPKLPGGSAYLSPAVLVPLASGPQRFFFLPLDLVVFFSSWAGFVASPVAAAVADPAQTPST